MASLLIKTAFHNSIAEGIYNEILYKLSRYYYFLGKELDWNIEDDPEEPENTFEYEMETRKNIIFSKLIGNNDVAFVVPRIDWESGEIYDMYDDIIDVSNPSYSGATTLESSRIYVMTPQFNVYKCIDNNLNSPSTEMPTDISDDIIEYADGYRWKFMYTIPASMRNKFLSVSHIPVFTALTSQFYFDGEITSLTINDGGSGYTTASITVSGDGYIENNPYIISSIDVSDPGDGYSAPPAITIEAPHVISGSEVQATATANLTGDTVTSVTIAEAGYGYTEIVDIEIDPPFVGTEFQTNTAYNDGEYVYHNKNYYLVVGTGLSGATPPTHTSGTVTNGAIDLTYVGRQAEVNVNTVKTEADIDAVLSGGEIVGYIINDGGIGYTFATITVSGDGTGAQLEANLSSGSIDTQQANVELLAVNGSIEAIKVINGGTGYGAATVIVDGDGTGLTADVTIDSGQIQKVNVLTSGQDYTWATITISGNGTGATARAILSPIGGHGKNAVNELFARTLVFYTSISSEKNQGITVNNDYRQLGIIKQLDEYGTTTKFKNLTGSACFRVFATFNQLDFPDDSVIYQSTTNRRFSVVETDSQSLLLRSIDGTIPLVGEVYRNESMVTFTVTSVTNPQINPYSGDLIYIDNRAGFVPSPEQTVVIKSIIGF